VALMGESAGTLLVSYLGTVKSDPPLAAVVGISGTHDLRRRLHPTGGCFVGGKFVPNPEPGKPQFCLPVGIGAYLNVTRDGRDTDRIIRAASPRERIRAGMPPYLLVHGTLDVNAPFEQSVFMYEAMRAAGQRADLLVVDGGGHGMGRWDPDPALAGYRARMVEWLKTALRR
jgi:acetyl esterase